MNGPGFSAEAVFLTRTLSVRRAGAGAWEWCECVGGCRVQTWCIGSYCYQTTICSDCAYKRNCTIVEG